MSLIKNSQNIKSAINQATAALLELEDQLKVLNNDSSKLVSIDELSRVIKKRRELMGLGIAEVAALAGISEASYKKIEADTGNPTLETLKSVSKALGIRLCLEL